MLAALRPAGRAARVHQKQRRLRRHRLRLHLLPTVRVQQLVDEEVATLDHRALRVVLAGVPPPHQHLLDLLTLLAGSRDRLVGLGLVIDQLAVARVRIHRHQDPALRVGHPVTTGSAREPAENLGVDHTHASARQHRDRQFRHHRQMERHPVTRLYPGEITQQRRELVHASMELPVGDLLRLLVLALRHPDQRAPIAPRFQVSIDAVHARVQTPAHPPLPERRLARVQNRVPPAIPRQHLRVLDEAIRVMLLAEALKDRRVRRVRLRDERRRRRIVLLLPPMNRDLRLRGGRLGNLRGRRCVILYSHCSTSHEGFGETISEGRHDAARSVDPSR